MTTDLLRARHEVEQDLRAVISHSLIVDAVEDELLEARRYARWAAERARDYALRFDPGAKWWSDFAAEERRIVRLLVRVLRAGRPSVRHG